MNILYIAPTDPRETAYGGQQRTHAIWEGLKSIPNAHVKVFVPVPHPKQACSDEASGIYRLCLDKRYAPGWILQRVFKRMIPYWNCSWAYDWKSLHRQFQNTDIVVVRYVAYAAAFKVWHLAPLYLDADDIHTMEFDIQSEAVGNSFGRRVQRWLLARFQFGVYKKARMIWVPAQEQVGLIPQYPFAYLPNIPCPPLPDVARTIGNKDKLFFVGLMSSLPNIVAIDRFLDEHWSAIKKTFPEMELDVAGSGLPIEYATKWSRMGGVNVLWFVKNIRPLYDRTLAFLAPMCIGMGSCIKIFESLAMGRPVLATPKGLRGIDPKDQIQVNGIYRYETTNELLTALAILRNLPDGVRNEQQLAARRYVQEKFSQKVVNGILSSVIGNRGGVA